MPRIFPGVRGFRLGLSLVVKVKYILVLSKLGQDVRTQPLLNHLRGKESPIFHLRQQKTSNSSTQSPSICSREVSHLVATIAAGQRAFHAHSEGSSAIFRPIEPRRIIHRTISENGRDDHFALSNLQNKTYVLYPAHTSQHMPDVQDTPLWRSISILNTCNWSPR